MEKIETVNGAETKNATKSTNSYEFEFTIVSKIYDTVSIEAESEKEAIEKFKAMKDSLIEDYAPDMSDTAYIDIESDDFPCND